MADYAQILNRAGSQLVQTPFVYDTDVAQWMAKVQNYVYTGTLWVPRKGDANSGFVAGPAAHDAAASGNPVQVGGVYRVADPALADGDAGSIRVNAKGEVLVELSGRNAQLLAEATITWNGVKLNDTVAIPATTAEAIMLNIDNSDTASALTATFELQVTTGEWRQWFDGLGGAVTFTVPASTKGVYGPFQTFPRYLSGRIKLANTIAPTDTKVTKVQAQEVA